jgi:hypothetical protein
MIRIFIDLYKMTEPTPCDQKIILPYRMLPVEMNFVVDPAASPKSNMGKLKVAAPFPKVDEDNWCGKDADDDHGQGCTSSFWSKFQRATEMAVLIDIPLRFRN